MTRRLSIVTVNLNQAAYLEQAMRSVLDQEYANLEYIVIDGGSTDGSVDIIRKYSESLAYWTSEPDRGQSHALNKGIQCATGEIVGWLNADDLYLGTTFERAVGIFEREPSVGMVYGNCIVLDEGTGARRLWAGVRPAGIQTLLADANGIPQPSAFVRRSVLEKTGLIDESFHLAMDYDLWLRIYKQTQVAYVPEPWSVVRDHAATKTRQQASRFVFEFIRAVDRFYASPGVPAEAWAVRSRAYARLYYSAAHMAAVEEHRPLAALGWLARALRHDPALLLRVPRGVRRVLGSASG